MAGFVPRPFGGEVVTSGSHRRGSGGGGNDKGGVRVGPASRRAGEVSAAGTAVAARNPMLVKGLSPTTAGESIAAKVITISS